MHRPQFESTGDATTMNDGNGPSPVTSSTGSASGKLFPNELERRHMEVTSHLAKLQDVSARQTWPAVFAGNTALGTCCGWVMQPADAFVQELHLLDRRMQEKSLAAELGRQKALVKELVDMEQRLKEVRGSRLTVYPATRQPHQFCAACGAHGTLLTSCIFDSQECSWEPNLGCQTGQTGALVPPIRTACLCQDLHSTQQHRLGTAQQLQTVTAGAEEEGTGAARTRGGPGGLPKSTRVYGC